MKPEINSQHRGIKSRGPAVAIGARFEREKPVDRAKLQARIRNENQISRGVNRKPGRQHVAGPEMQKNRNQRDLLRNSQHHLEKICGPPRKQPSRAARARNRHRDLCIVARIGWTQIKVEIPSASQAGYQPDGWMSIVDAGTGSALLAQRPGSVVDSRDGNRQFGGRLDPAGSDRPLQAGEVETVTTDYIPFNRPYATGNELVYAAEAQRNHHLSGDGSFTRRCHQWIEQRTGCARALLTHSCTSALDLAALLLDIESGDEVILPSYTFVSTANAFVLRGAVPVFVDIREDTLNLDERLIEAAITPRTRAIVPVHYAGVSCEMDAIVAIARRHDLRIVEDAAQGIMAGYKGRALGAIGDLGTFSFHETKNIISGEGGSLLVSDPDLVAARRNHSREGHRPRQVFSRRSRQIHLAGRRLVIPAERNHRGISLGAARRGAANYRGADRDLAALPRNARAAGAAGPAPAPDRAGGLPA